jgi:N-acetylmuramoyl-L-alanine amidase
MAESPFGGTAMDAVASNAPPTAVGLDDPRLALEREKWETERNLRERELALREADRPSPWRSPLTIAIVAAAMAGTGNAVVSRINGSAQLKLQQVQGQAGADLERIKAEQNLIIEAIKTGGDVDKAAANLEFLVNAGLVADAARARQIRHYLAVNRLKPDRLPSLPSVGQTQPPAPRRAAPVPVSAPASVPVAIATMSPRDNPALKVTNRARAIVPGQTCQAGGSGSYCVANDVLVNSTGRPVAVANAAYHGDKMRPPQLIVFHSTFSGDRSAVRAMTAADTPVRSSAHVVIDHDGTITQLVPFDVASYHVGMGVWNGITTLNSQSIGIEFSNWGRLRGGPGAWRTWSGTPVPDDMVFTTAPNAEGQVEGWEKFTEAQLAAADRIVAALVRKYPTIRGVAGHAEVARPAGRRTDPGPALSLDRFRALLSR